MEPEIKIAANLDPKQPDTCRLVVDQMLYEGTATFPTPTSAQGSALPEKLFAIEGITVIRLAGNEVTVTKGGAADWSIIARKLGEAIRAHLHSGAPAVSDAFEQSLIPDGEMRTALQELFDSDINPAVAQHGGHVELVEVKKNRVYLRLGGGCQGCGMANITLRRGIDAAIRERLPQVKDIVDVTDHAAGMNPYYAASAS